jgi:hypothetical protein
MCQVFRDGLLLFSKLVLRLQALDGNDIGSEDCIATINQVS